MTAKEKKDLKDGTRILKMMLFTHNIQLNIYASSKYIHRINFFLAKNNVCKDFYEEMEKYIKRFYKESEKYKQFQNMFFAFSASSPSSFIIGAFSWSGARNGESFWRDIYDKSQYFDW